ncbi:hypothetical protein [Bythopirellula goksoeyrii]|uniref:Uncharacterized protein n=1 Tax=Bythopirellula goksoeyrii TaxID=1400387 RepID=A0A5B9QTU3_9BACT|nr:hypothetical protein [Bythopirellula goksoeyrii]QEG37531.1 hypothetical protein Pr1d_48770 [Bythopirellula goksoeyrii]
MKTIFCTLSLLTATVSLPALAQSDTKPTVETLTASSLWTVQASPERLFSSNFGRILEDLISAKHPDALAKMDSFADALGFDPRTAVTDILMLGDNFDGAPTTAIVQLGATSGNLEGWLLAAPGYQSEDLDENTILHSFILEKGDNPRIWCAIPRNPVDKQYTLVATFERDRTIELTNKVIEKGTTWLATPSSANTFLSVSVNDFSKLPMKIDSDDPGSAIVRTIRSVNMQASAEDDTLTAHGELTAGSPARAQQLQQLLTGLKAMVQLAAMHEDNHDSDRHDPYAFDQKNRPHHDKKGAKKAAELLNNLTVDHQAGSSTLTANFKISYDALMALKNGVQEFQTYNE